MKKIEEYKDFEDILACKYREANYKVLDTGARTGRCMICFSSNGIYYPDTREEVIRRLVEQDRYEWEHVMKASALRGYFERIIFVRDIYKQWYVTGINREIDTLDKLASLLRELTTGFQLYTCGNSAGGYAAVILGIMLGARRAYSFSGYFSLDEIGGEAPLIEEGRAVPEKYRYYDLRPFVKDTSCEIFYFYPGRSEIDLKQAACVEGNAGIHFFRIDRKVHGATVWDVTYKYIFKEEPSEWIALGRNGKMRSPFVWELRTAGIGGGCRDLMQWSGYKCGRLVKRICH